MIPLNDYLEKSTVLGHLAPSDEKMACDTVLSASDFGVKSQGGEWEEQPEMIFLFEFREPVKLHHVKIEGLSEGSRPNKVKIFQGKKSLGFSNTSEPGAEFELNDDFYNSKDKSVVLPYAKWQNCWDVQVWISSNEKWDKNNDPEASDPDEDINNPTEVKSIQFFGQTNQVLDQSKWTKPKGWC